MTWWQWYRHPIVFLVAVVAVACYCAVVIHPRTTVFAILAVGIAVMGLLAPWVLLRGVRGEVKIGQLRGEVGRPLRLRANLQSNWWLPVGGLVVDPGFAPVPATRTADRSADDRREDSTTLAVAAVPARSPASFGWQVTPWRRGVYPSTSATVTTGFPFGLMHATRRLSTQGRVIVWPAMTSLAPWNPPAGRLTGGATTSNRPNGTTGDLTGARPWQEGESLRRIHWPLTARHDRIIACERSTTTAGDIEIAVETDPAVHSAGEGVDTLETCLSCAASIAASFADRSLPSATAFGRQAPVEVDHQDGLHRLLDALSRHSDADAASLTELCLRLNKRRKTEHWRVLITTQPGLERLNREVAHRQRQIVFVVDPSHTADGHEIAATGPHVFHVRADGNWMSNLQNSWSEAIHAC